MVKFFKRFLKYKFLKCIEQHKKENFELYIQIFFYFLFLIGFIILYIYINKTIDFIDISILTSGLMVLTINLFIKSFSRRLYLMCEDQLKTMCNYTCLMNSVDGRASCRERV